MSCERLLELHERLFVVGEALALLAAGAGSNVAQLGAVETIARRLGVRASAARVARAHGILGPRDVSPLAARVAYGCALWAVSADGTSGRAEPEALRRRLGIGGPMAAAVRRILDEVGHDGADGAALDVATLLLERLVAVPRDVDDAIAHREAAS
jgi:hypothetical protein